MKDFDKKLQEIEADDLGNLSTREKAIAERAAERAEILVLNGLLEYQQKYTTEAWRVSIRNLVEAKAEDYYKKYS